jgi:hypothetical protein
MNVSCMTYDVPLKETLQPRVLFVQEVDKKRLPTFVRVGQEAFKSSQDADDLSAPRSIEWHKMNERKTYMLSFTRALSIQDFISRGRKPKIRSMAPRTSLFV